MLRRAWDDFPRRLFLNIVSLQILCHASSSCKTIENGNINKFRTHTRTHTHIIIQYNMCIFIYIYIFILCSRVAVKLRAGSAINIIVFPPPPPLYLFPSFFFLTTADNCWTAWGISIMAVAVAPAHDGRFQFIFFDTAR